jgi:hypothetical protein
MKITPAILILDIERRWVCFKLLQLYTREVIHNTLFAGGLMNLIFILHVMMKRKI